MMNMIQNCSASSREKVDDMLSDLPLEIIHRIIELIPIKEVVRTSVLSKQWRYTWTTLPRLVFDHDKATSNYEDLISEVLSHHRGPVHKFRMDCPGDFKDLDEWILGLSRNDIRELILLNQLETSHYPLLEMHSSLYSCKKLTCLRLYGCKLDPLPLNFKGFLFLRSLCLGRVSLSADEIYRLVAVCPLLESFEFFESEEVELKISAPNLKYMRFKGHYGKICINAPLMIEISAALTRIKGPDQQLKSSACDFAKCFGGFTNLQKLFGGDYFTKYLSLGIELSHHSLVFHKLKLIHLQSVNFEDVKEIMGVAHLVIGAPNLQELKIRGRFGLREADESNSEAPHLSFKDLGCASNFKLARLRNISLDLAKSHALELLKFLLEISPALETMNVGLQDNNEEKWNNLRTKLEGCNWASPTTKLCNKRLPATSQLPYYLSDCW